jgi:hypothetical protein
MIGPALLVFAAPAVMAETSGATPQDMKQAQRFGEQFELAGDTGSKIEVLSYSSPRDLRICNLTGNGGYFKDEGFVPLWERAAASSVRQGSTLAVSHDGREDRLQTGQCDELRSDRVALSLDENPDVNGTFVGSVTVNGPAPGYSQ